MLVWRPSSKPASRRQVSHETTLAWRGVPHALALPSRGEAARGEGCASHLREPPYRSPVLKERLKGCDHPATGTNSPEVITDESTGYPRSSVTRLDVQRTCILSKRASCLPPKGKAKGTSRAPQPPPRSAAAAGSGRRRRSSPRARSAASRFHPSYRFG